MLHFRDSRDGGIDLSGAHPSGLAQLLAGRPTRLSSLIRDHEILADARRRARSIRSKAEQLDNERGIRTAHLAIGFASWTEKDSKFKFNAPVVLRHITLVPRGSRVEDYEIVLGNEITINPALVRHLAEAYDLEVPVDEWVDATGGPHGFDPGPALDRLRDLAQAVPGLRINHRFIVSTFANIASSFTGDYLPTQHPILRALAGDDGVGRQFGGGSTVPCRTPRASGEKAESARDGDEATRRESRDGVKRPASAEKPTGVVEPTEKSGQDEGSGTKADSREKTGAQTTTGTKSDAGAKDEAGEKTSSGETTAPPDARRTTGSESASAATDEDELSEPTVPITSADDDASATDGAPGDGDRLSDWVRFSDGDRFSDWVRLRDRRHSDERARRRSTRRPATRRTSTRRPAARSRTMHRPTARRLTARRLKARRGRPDSPGRRHESGHGAHSRRHDSGYGTPG
ncbi:DUF4011 domain-containing protein [Brevibacterium casei]|nr:DUF4011 domain-containing protein [Brevibacterium casei]